MSTYRLERRLSHADVDFLGELKVSALLGLLEQAAVEASSGCGFDAARYTREGRMWIIRRTRLERLVPVGGVDMVEVTTGVADFRRVRSLRRYTVWRGGIAVAQASTDWVYCDLRTGQPARIPEELQRAFMGSAGAPALPRAPAVEIDRLGVPVEFAVTAQPSHLDHVTHVNNAIYASYLEDGAFRLFVAHGWPLQRMLAAQGALRIRWLDIEYLSDAFAGDALTVRSWLQNVSTFAAAGGAPPAGAQLVQAIVHADGRDVIRAASDWIWRHKPTIIGGVPMP